MHRLTTADYRNVLRLREKLVAAVETGRAKLTRSEFDSWAPQLQRKIEEIDVALRQYELSLIYASLSVAGYVYSGWHGLSSRAIAPVQPAVVLNSPTRSNFLIGTVGSARCAQRILPLC